MGGTRVAAERPFGAVRGLAGGVGLAVALVLGLSGCAGDDEPADAPTTADQATQACRQQWGELADTLRGRDQQTDPSDLAARWTSLIATARYYETGAKASDCDVPLVDQRQDMRRIEEFSDRLRQFDISYRMTSLAPVATDYLLNPLPEPRRVDGSLRRPPPKKEVRRALRTLQDQAALSATDMVDGWNEANTIDLSNAAAVRRTVRDLTFLSRDSAPFRACVDALALLERARTFAE